MHCLWALISFRNSLILVFKKENNKLRIKTHATALIHETQIWLIPLFRARMYRLTSLERVT